MDGRHHRLGERVQPVEARAAPRGEAARLGRASVSDLSKSIFAPATKLSFLPEMKTTAFTAASFSDAARAAPSNSAPDSGESVFTGSPGWSKVTTATPSSTP